MGTMVSGAIALLPQAVQAASLTQWHYDPTSNRLEVTLDQGTTPRYFLMAQPARIVLDLPDTAVGSVQSQGTYSGAIRQIRVSQFQPGLTRIVLELSPDVELAPGQVKLEKANHPTETSRWVLRPLIAQASPVQPSAKGAPSAATVSRISEPAPPTQAAVPPLPTKQPPVVRPAPFPVESPTPIQVQVPPLSSQPVQAAGASARPEKPIPARVVNAEKILPPPTPIPMGSDDGLKDPEPSQVALALPSASKTPLPPSSSPSELAIDTRNAIKISVPPPLSGLPTGTQIPDPVNVKPVASASAMSPATSPPPVKATPTAVSRPVTASLAMDMPSTVRMLPSSASTISVPTLGSPKSVSVSSVSTVSSPASSLQVTTPLPPQAQLPPLAPLPSTPSPMPVAPSEPVSKGATPPAQIANTFPATSTIPGAEGLPASSIPNLPAGQTPSVMVPPLAPTSGNPAPLRQVPAAPSPSMPSPIAPLVPTASVPLQPTPTLSPAGIAATPSSAKPSTVVAFGQPLPATGASALNTFPRGVATYPATPTYPALAGSVQQAFVQSPNPSVLLPLGATLNLVYPGNTVLKLPSGPPLQEVLLLQTEVRDASGNVVFPQGTYVLGRFDTNGNGSKFIAQAIAVGERSIPFAAESNSLSNNRDLSTTTMAIGSGVGALVGGAVSSFSGLGLLGGAAAGAATSFLASPKQVMLQPGQVIQVQVKQDLLLR